MKMIKVKKSDDSMELFDYCRKMEREFRNKFPNMELYVDAPILKDDEVEIRINWSAIGSQRLAEAKKFATNISALVGMGEKIEKELKKKFPGVKISK